MSKKALLFAGIVGALGFTMLAGSSSSIGQVAGAASDSLEDKINPPVANCNVTPDSNANQNPPPSKIVPTPITRSLLTSGQPCAQTVSGKGPHGNDLLLNLQRGFDFYSWLTFVALNSPNDGAPIGESKKGQDPTTVWEDINNYMQLADVMLPEGRPPTWGVRDTVPPQCKDFREGMMLIRMTEETFNQPFKSGPLIDQNGNYALFDILMNEPMFAYIAEHRLYSVQGQEEFAGPIVFPSGSNPTKDKDGKPILGRMGAIMLKVSWKVLGDNDDPRKFHTVDAVIYTPPSEKPKTDATCVRRKLGLVGFHAVHKTAFAPQWIWTTFEHVDNVPDKEGVKAHKSRHYNFFNSARAASRTPNELPPQPWNPSKEPFANDFKSQIVREISVTDDAPALNKAFQMILAGTVWANYMLISTQWPTDARSATDPTGAPAPTFLANTTLETYSQGKMPIASSSCMACHGNATTQHKPATPSDFTFTLEKAH